MKGKRVLLPVGCAVICLLGVSIVLLSGKFSRRDRRTVAAQVVEAPLDPRVAQLQRDVEILRASHRGIAAGIQEQRNASAALGAAMSQRHRDKPEDDEPGAGQSADVTGEAAERRARQKLEVLEQTLSGQRVDAQWAPRARQALLTAYASEQFPGLNPEAECKETMCRVTFSVQDTEQGRIQMRMVGMRAPWASYGFINYDFAKGTGTFFLAREGHPLPQGSAAEPAAAE